MSTANEVIMFSFTIAVATILNMAALIVLFTRRPMGVMDTLLLHIFVTGMAYGVLRFADIIILSPGIHHLDNEPLLEAALWLFGNIQMAVLGLIACQRFVAVYIPFKAKSWCTKNRTFKSIFGIYLFVVITTCLLMVIQWQFSSVTIGDIIYIMAVFRVSVSAIMFSVYFVIFLKLFLLKRTRITTTKTTKDSERGVKRRIKPYLFSLIITCSNLISFIPVLLHVFAHGTISLPLHIMLLAWVDLIFNPVSYIVMKRGKRIREIFRSVFRRCCWWRRKKSVACHFYKKKRNSETDSSNGIGNTL